MALYFGQNQMSPSHIAPFAVLTRRLHQFLAKHFSVAQISARNFAFRPRRNERTYYLECHASRIDYRVEIFERLPGSGMIVVGEAGAAKPEEHRIGYRSAG